jgi:DNA-binding NtrC family response regulator
MSKNKVLIVDDEKDILDLISDIVDDAGYIPLRLKTALRPSIKYRKMHLRR